MTQTHFAKFRRVLTHGFQTACSSSNSETSRCLKHCLDKAGNKQKIYWKVLHLPVFLNSMYASLLVMSIFTRDTPVSSSNVMSLDLKGYYSPFGTV